MLPLQLPVNPLKMRFSEFPKRADMGNLQASVLSHTNNILYIDTPSTTAVIVGNSSGAAFKIDTSTYPGKLGINTGTLTNALDIIGNSAISGNLSVGTITGKQISNTGVFTTLVFNEGTGNFLDIQTTTGGLLNFNSGTFNFNTGNYLTSNTGLFTFSNSTNLTFINGTGDFLTIQTLTGALLRTNSGTFNFNTGNYLTSNTGLFNFTSINSGSINKLAFDNGTGNFLTLGTGFFNILYVTGPTAIIDLSNEITVVSTRFLRNASSASSTFFGKFGAVSAGTSNNNSSFGHANLGNPLSGAFNSSLGRGSLSSVGFIDNNSAFGQFSLGSVATGSNNTAFGFQSGLDVRTGAFLTFVGALAGNTDGSAGGVGSNTANNFCTGSIAIGAKANITAINIGHATTIGADSTVSTANTIQLGTTLDIVNVSNQFKSKGFVNVTGCFQNSTFGTNISGDTIGAGYYFADTSAGNMTVNLPLSANRTGARLFITKGPTNTLTIQPTAPNVLYSGGASVANVTISDWLTMSLIADGNNSWYTVSLSV